MAFDIPAGSRVAVAMSGGVDSSTTAAMLKKEGYEVIGLTLRLHKHYNAKDAVEVAAQHGIEHYVLDQVALFQKEIIDDFVDGYLKGETPNPCSRCNKKVKFGKMLETAQELGCHALVTGHYARRVIGPSGIAELHRATDPKRDQSYFLFSTKQDYLEYVRFPLGEFEKTHTRAIARDLGLPVADKPDSQDICFVPEGRYAEVIEHYRPNASIPGDIVDKNDKVLGQHEGIAKYTIGQRRGLNVSGNEPLYVVAIYPEYNQIVLGQKEDLLVKDILLRDVNLLVDVPPEGLSCNVKLRSAGQFLPALVTMLDETQAHVHLIEGEYGVAKGQVCAFYEGSRVLGGGWIQQA